MHRAEQPEKKKKKVDIIDDELAQSTGGPGPCRHSPWPLHGHQRHRTEIALSTFSRETEFLVLVGLGHAV